MKAAGKQCLSSGRPTGSTQAATLAASDPLPTSSVGALLDTLTPLAALFHDLGKLCLQFLRKLTAVHPTGERIRHESLSYLMLEHWMHRHPDWLSVLCERPALLSEMVDKTGRLVIDADIERRLRHGTQADCETLAQELAERLLKSLARGDDPVRDGLLWLVLTHHHSIAAVPAAEGRWLDARPSLVAQMNPALPFDDANLQAARGAPWADAAWLADVQQQARIISHVLREAPELSATLRANPHAHAALLALVARPQLVLGDYIASSRKTASGCTARRKIAHANSIRTEHGRRVLGDTLPEHLRKAGQATRRVSDAYGQGSQAFGALSLKAVPGLQPDAPVPVAFAWQQRAAQTVARVPDIAARPFFAVLASATGSGKTFAGPKVLAAASGGALRVTCALGLRSLTLQTGRAYVKDMGIPQDRTATVIGDALYARLSGEDEHAAQGSESLALGDELLVLGQPDIARAAQALGVSRDEAESVFGSSKTLQLLAAPVLTCTVDHVMAASVMDAASNARLMLRLATSDLLLDEVDNYSYEDLQALGRLVYAAGVHGRRVVLMSATVSSAVVTELYRQWLNGIACFQWRTGDDTAPVLALVSDRLACRIVQRADAEQADSAVRGFYEEMCRVRDKPWVLAEFMGLEKTLVKTFERLYQKALSLARKHRTRRDGHSQTFSAGVVKFNQVAWARAFTEYVHWRRAQEGEPSVKVQCYHARMPMALLSRVEKQLLAVLVRKDPQAVFTAASLADWPAGATGERVLLVVTTSLPETGRDHDYDWAITEPSATRAHVQLAGRLLRHRRWRAHPSPNFVILERTLRSAFATTPARYDFPVAREPLGRGRELWVALDDQDTGTAGQVWDALHKAGHVPAPPRPGWQMTRASSYLPKRFHEEGIAADACLLATQCEHAPLSMLEHVAAARRMSAPREKYPSLSLRTMLESRGPDTPHELLWARHARDVVFRREEGARTQFALELRRDGLGLVAVGKNRMGRVCALQRDPVRVFTATRLPHPERAFVRLDLVDIGTLQTQFVRRGFVTPREQLLALSFEARIDPAQALTAELDYDPLLGACETTVRWQTPAR